MATKKRYYKLDEVGFVGVQKKGNAQVKKDIADTVQFIKARKAAIVTLSQHKTPTRSRLVKAK